MAGAVEPSLAGTPPRVTVDIPAVSLPNVSHRIEDVVATVTTDQSIRWSAEAQIRDADVISVVAVPVPFGQEVLAPGTHQIQLRDTRLFKYAGPHQVRLFLEDVSTGEQIGEVWSEAPVIGRLRKPDIRGVARKGTQVVVRGKASPFPAGVRVEVQFKPRGSKHFRKVDSAHSDVSWRWTSRFKARRAGLVRVRAVSEYGTSSLTARMRVAPTRR